MVKNKYFKFSVNEFKDIAKKNGDGIYVIYSDHLSCDAWYMFAIKNGDILQETHPSCWQTRNYYGDGSYCGGAYNLEALHKNFPELTIYISNLSYHTFCGKWMYHNWVEPNYDEKGSFYSSHYPYINHEILDVMSTAEPDPVPSWIDNEL